jgi:hypothetical protein
MKAAAPRYGPSPIRLFPMSEFTGGWNLRADAFQLGPTESPDLLDVTVEIGGGFVQRQVVQPYATAAAGPIQNLWSFSTPSTQQVLAQYSVSGTSYLAWTTGSTWTQVATLNPSQKARAAVLNNVMYVVSGAAAVIRWDGTTATALNQNWNETIGGEGASDLNMPMARLACAHAGRMFVAYTTESGTEHPSRLRWSHIGCPEDWRQEDYIDIDVGRDGDFITALVEFRDRLYIFKNNSISILSGYSTTNFAVTTISQDIGAVSQEAVCTTDVGLFNFSWPQGVYLDRGTGPYPIFDRIFPLIRDAWIPSAYRQNICMGWVNQNLWCSIPYGSGATYNTRTLVYNPWIFKNRYLRFLQGPWYPYSMGIGAFARVMQPSGPTMYLAAKANDVHVGQLEQNGFQDNWGSGATNISSYFRTRWIDIGSPSVVKRWRPPDIALRNPGSGKVLVEVRKDYNPSVVHNVFQVGTPSSGVTGMLWDDGSGTVGGKWDDGTGTVGGQWSDLPVSSEVIAQGASMGPARAVQLSFYAPTGQYWGVDALSFKYIPKRIHG